MWEPFERQKLELSFLREPTFSGFGTWKFTIKEDLIPRKQVFLLNLRFWPAQKTKICFLWEKFIYENSVVRNIGAFGVKISTFPPVCRRYPCCIVCRIYYGLVAGM